VNRSNRQSWLVNYESRPIRLAYWLLVALLFATVSLDRLHWLIQDKAWINPYHEGFAMMFMTAIKMEMGSDVWYHYFGLTGLSIVTGILHRIAQAILGGSEFTFDYFDLFGKLLFLCIYASIFGSLLVIVIRTHNRPLGIPVLAMLLVLNWTIYFSYAYHRIVNYLGFFELYLYFYAALIIYLITSFQKGRLSKHAPILAVAGGGLAGSLFFDLSIFGWLFLFFAAALFVLTAGRLRWRCLGLAIVSGVFIGPFMLWMAYGYHFVQATISFFHHLSVIAHGVEAGQPGFKEEFFGLFLSPRSEFFQRHIMIVCATAIWIICIVKDFFRPTDSMANHEQQGLRLVGISFDLAFMLTVLAIGYAFYRHPTFTVADSLALLCLFYSGCRLSIAVCVKDPTVRIYLRTIPLASLVVLAGLAAGYVPYPRGPSGVYFRFIQPGDFFFNDRTEARLVRSLDHFVGKFAEHYTVLEGPSSYSMVSLAIFPLRYATTLIFARSVGGAPQFLPIQTEVEQKYVRRYHFLTETSVVGFLDSCQVGIAPPAIYADQLQSKIESCATVNSPLGSKVFNAAASRLRLGDEVYLFPYPIPLGNAAYDVAVKSTKWRTPPEAGTSSPRHLLSTADRIGLKAEVYGSSEKSFGWSVVPVELDAVKPGLTPFVAPIVEGGYRSYLLRIDGTMFTSYVVIFVREDVAP